MASKRDVGLTKNRHKIHYSRINLWLYGFLLFATPFIMLQMYLQDFVRHLSSTDIHFFQISIPLIPVLAFILLTGMAIFFRKHLTIRNLILFVVVLFLLFLGQTISDYYIDYQFYDLQNNWHYFAYGIFAFIIYSHFTLKSVPLWRINFYIFGIAALISLGDEIFQFFISRRIFDLSDVAKDLWGVTIALFIILFGVEKRSFRLKIPKGKETGIRDLLKDPVTGFFILFLFSLSFLVVSSLLTDHEYIFQVFVISLLIFGLFLWLFFIFLKKRRIFLFGIILILSIQAVSFAINHKMNFTFHNQFVSVYKGIPLLFFDVMIFPDKTFRFVDKKTKFNMTDKKVMLKKSPDIILIGSGEHGDGGEGFPYKDKSHFIYNPLNNKGVQVIILDSGEAIMKYNELVQKGKKVLFVLHNSF